MRQDRHSSASLLERRDFLKLTALAAGSTLLPDAAYAEAKPATISSLHPDFPTSDPRWLRTWDAALGVLAGNIHVLPRFEHPVLVEGSVYPGIWLECGPHEGLVYGTLAPYIATWLAKNYGLQYVGYYLSGAALITLAGLITIRETKDEAL